MIDQDTRAALEQHWAASDAGDFETEHDIYLDDAVLEYPQSGERIRGRRNIQTTRTLQANKKRFQVRRILGGDDLWITEYILTYDDQPSFTVSIMEFRDGKVARETQYSAIPSKPAHGAASGSSKSTPDSIIRLLSVNGVRRQRTVDAALLPVSLSACDGTVPMNCFLATNERITCSTRATFEAGAADERGWARVAAFAVIRSALIASAAAARTRETPTYKLCLVIVPPISVSLPGINCLPCLCEA